MELTKVQQEFIRSEFKTPKGGILTVVGCHKKNNRGVPIFTLECSICSEDQELWPSGSISAIKTKLVNRAQIPCGCSGNTRWTEQQYIIKVKRLVEGTGCEFVGWASGFKGLKTKMRLRMGDLFWETSDLHSTIHKNKIHIPFKGNTHG